VKQVNGYPKDKHGLTERQREVMVWAAKGHDSFQIGAALGMSHYSVKHVISRVYKVLGINTRAELALEAQRIGLLNGSKR
jgi:DNA-binding CsgD family transcriptional regulator